MQVKSIGSSESLNGIQAFFHQHREAVTGWLRQLLYILMILPLPIIYAFALIVGPIDDPDWYDGGSFIEFFAEFSFDMEDSILPVLLYFGLFIATRAAETCALSRPESTVRKVLRSVLLFATCAIGVMFLLSAVVSSWSIYVLRFRQIEVSKTVAVPYYLLLTVFWAQMVIAYTREVRRTAWESASCKMIRQCGVLAFLALMITVWFSVAMTLDVSSLQTSRAVYIGATGSWTGVGLCAVVALFMVNVYIWSAEDGR